MKYSLRELIIDKISGEWGDEPVNGQGSNILRTTNFTNTGRINFEKVVKRNIPEDKVKKKHLKCGDVIIEKSGGSPNQPVGRVVFFEQETDERYLCNNFTAILRPDIEKIYPKYFFYRLYILHTRGRTLKYQNKTTGIINLKLDNYLEEKIDIPELSEQKHISELLSKAESLIAQRKESIRLLDEFLKSTFLEMFGDPVRNEKGWDVSSLSDYGAFKNGLNYSKNETGVSIKCLGVGDFKDLSKITDIDSLTALNLTSEPSEDYYLKDGDIVFVRSNGNKDLVGRCILAFPSSEKVFYSGFCIRYRIEKQGINPTFLLHLLRAPIFRISLLQGGRGANIQNINQQTLSGLKILIPPIELQTYFTKIVERTETLKTKYQQSLQEIEILYSSLGQQAFKGGIRGNYKSIFDI